MSHNRTGCTVAMPKFAANISMMFNEVDFLDRFATDRHSLTEKVIRAERFPVGQARQIRFDLYRDQAAHYYGAVIEVSRGCPFLCEFCDIRVLPGNNRSNNKAPELIVSELDEYHKLGITQYSRHARWSGGIMKYCFSTVFIYIFIHDFERDRTHTVSKRMYVTHMHHIQYVFV